MRRRTTRKRAGAFTLVEVMVVVLIIGMLAGIVTKVVVDKIETARVQKARAEISEFMGALDLFYIEQSFYPSTAQGLEALVHRPDDDRIKTWPEHGYLPVVPLDPWSNEYDYISPGVEKSFEIVCYGRDGAEGGAGPDADITSWTLAEVKGNE